MCEEKQQCLTITSPRISTLVQAFFRQSERNCSNIYPWLFQGPEADDEFGTVPDLQGAYCLLEEVGSHALLSIKPWDISSSWCVSSEINTLSNLD